MRRPPFDRLPDLEGVYDAEQYSLLLDHLAKSTVQSDYLIAICGADGSGKTTLLNRFLLSLGEDVCVARLDETYKGVREFYCAVLRQLGFHDIDGKPEELRRITREFIVNRGMASEPVLLVIDNAHLISPFILEQLRWLSAIKVDEVRVLSCVLAGNSDLMRIMDSTAMSQFAFNNYIRFHIRAYTESETMDYVWNRLHMAGCSDGLSISDAARPLIHRFSGGIPRLINILCDAVLQEASTLGSTEITDEMLRNVAERRHLVPHVLPYAGKGRRRSDPDFDASNPAFSDTRSGSASGDSDDAGMGQDRNSGSSAGLQQQVLRMSKKIAELKEENRRYLAQIDERDDDIRNLREALQGQALRHQGLEKALGDKALAYDELSRSMSGRSQALERSEESNRQLVATVRKDREELTELRVKLAAAMADSELLAELRNESRELRRQLASADRDKQTIARLQTQAREYREKLDAAAGYSDTIEALERDVGELRAQLDESRAENESIADLQQEAATLRHELAAAADDKSTIDGLRLEIDALHERLASSAEERESLTALQREVLELREQHGVDDEAVTRLEAELSRSMETLGDLEDELAAKNLAIDELQRQAMAQEELLAQKAALVSDMESIVEAHDQEVTLLQSRIDELESEQLATSDRLNQFASLEAHATECESQVQALQSQLDDAQCRNDRAMAETDVLVTDEPADSTPGSGEPAWQDDDGRSRVPIRTIEVFNGASLEQVVRIGEGRNRIMIGRDNDNDLVLDSNFISRHHAILSLCDDGSAVIEDLNSLNGVVVNQTKLLRSVLRVGDVVILGNFCLLPGPA